jgi:hypothetical protein
MVEKPRRRLNRNFNNWNGGERFSGIWCVQCLGIATRRGCPRIAPQVVL